MIKFFRKIRQRLLTENKFSKYLIYAVGEIILVVIGILIALSINNWNETRKNSIQENFILNKIRADINSDIKEITDKTARLQRDITNFKFCIEVLAHKKEVTREEFILKFGQILGIINFDQNTTTFDNLVSSGKIELIKNQSLLDSIVIYYNQDYQDWDTAMRDYTRNIIAPYLINYDHIPQMNLTHGAESSYSNMNFYVADISQFDVKPKTIEDYRKNIFIINVLRQKLFNCEGQKGLYHELLANMKNLIHQIDKELR